MTAIRSHRRSSFGTDCVQCGSELIAPEWTEYRNERQVHHVWRCWYRPTIRRCIRASYCRNSSMPWSSPRPRSAMRRCGSSSSSARASARSPGRRRSPSSPSKRMKITLCRPRAMRRRLSPRTTRALQLLPLPDLVGKWGRVMTSVRKIEANRRNSRKSCGPRTAAGKSIASRNALQHGLAALTHRQPLPVPEIEQFARALCGNDNDPALFAQAAQIAQNEMDLREIHAHRVYVIERLRAPYQVPFAKKDNSLELGRRAQSVAL